MSDVNGKVSSLIASQIDFANTQLALLRTEYEAATQSERDSIKDDMEWWTQCAISLSKNIPHEEPDEDDTGASDYDDDNMGAQSSDGDAAAVISVFSPGKPMGFRG